MSSSNISGVRGWTWSALVILAAAAGCSRQQSVDARMSKALADSGMKKASLFQLAGSIMIDGQPPKFEDRKKHLVVMLNDPQNPKAPVRTRPHVLVGDDGRFKFSEDGIAAGHYVLTFAVLKRKGPGTFVGPDDLHNLYNDPDVNAKNSQLVIDHKAPGKKDYEFNLEVAGKESVQSPGPQAMTSVK